MSYTPPNLAIAIPTFIGSLMSFLATFAAIVAHFFIPPKKHFRHALIVNLLISDFLNSLNNTVSGGLTLSRGHTSVVDAGCIANGWVNQLTVSAVDWNILIISIVVLCTVLKSNMVAQSSMTMSVLICLAAWVPGIITSFVALGLDVYGQVSGNWCWIRPEFLMLRYALTHGWRLAIFFATIGIYTYIYIHLRQQFGKLRLGNPSSGSEGTSTHHTVSGNDHGDGGLESVDTQHILATTSFEVTLEMGERPNGSKPTPAATTQWSVSADKPKQAHFQTAEQSHDTSMKSPRKSAVRPLSKSNMPPPPNLKKMMLMNGYPIAYIILWIPGIANRLTESLNGSSPVWLKALQSSTQFVGFVNAVTYGFSEQRVTSLKQMFHDRRGFRRTGD